MNKLVWLVTSIWLSTAALAQDITNHAVPVGGGPGAVGWKAAGPCATGLVLGWTSGTGADPGCQSGGPIIDSLCAVNNSLLGRIAGTWGCVTAGVSQILVSSSTAAPVWSNVLPDTFFGTGRPWLDVKAGIPNATTFTGAISGTTLTVSAPSASVIGPGMTITGTGVTAGTVILANGSGTGGAGTYTVNNSQSIGSESMIGSCNAASGNGVSDDWTAVQCAVTYLGLKSAGVVYLPPGNYLVSRTVTVAGSVYLQGAGGLASEIKINSDITALAFNANILQAGLDRLIIDGNTSSPTANLVTIGNGALVNLSNCVLTGGNWALATNGVDGNVLNCSIAGWGSSGGGVLSQGANTYWNAKIDQSEANTTAAFKQGVGYNGSLMENRIVSSDMTGNYTNSLVVADTNNLAITLVTNTVLSEPVSITGNKDVVLTGDEINGNVTISAGRVMITGGQAATAITATASGSGLVVCAGNSPNISCWQSFTPSVSCGAGTITTLGTVTGQFMDTGDKRFIEIVINITTNGTCATSLVVTLPSTPASQNYFIGGSEQLTTGVSLVGRTAGTNLLNVTNYNNAYAGGNGAKLVLDGWYRTN